MREGEFTRRRFHQLTAAAFAGAVAGSSAGFAQDKKKDEESLLLKEPHVCRGLNTCKGIGAGKKNDCAGMGQCATAKAHECKGMNECKGQSGCGEKPGENACKGMGECAVPLSDKAWKTARKNFETAMKKAGKKFGDAPPPKKT
uniref:Uncharacterized protein n=1 Tax=Schlesneria paludicola TaxID=360056 RepID=A0A7C2P2Y9_9PLAN